MMTTTYYCHSIVRSFNDLDWYELSQSSKIIIKVISCLVGTLFVLPNWQEIHCTYVSWEICISQSLWRDCECNINTFLLWALTEKMVQLSVAVDWLTSPDGTTHWSTISSTHPSINCIHSHHHKGNSTTASVEVDNKTSGIEDNLSFVKCGASLLNEDVGIFQEAVFSKHHTLTCFCQWDWGWMFICIIVMMPDARKTITCHRKYLWTFYHLIKL